MIKNLYKIILLTIIIFLFGDSFLFCENAENLNTAISEKEISNNNSNVTSQEFYKGIAIFFGILSLYLLTGMFIRLDKVVSNTTLNKSVSFESMSSYVESLSDYYDNPNVGYPETKRNQP